MDELIGKECGCEFADEFSKWPVPGTPAWVIVDAVALPLVKMRSKWAGEPFWINAERIKRIWLANPRAAEEARIAAAEARARAGMTTPLTPEQVAEGESLLAAADAEAVGMGHNVLANVRHRAWMYDNAPAIFATLRAQQAQLRTQERKLHQYAAVKHSYAEALTKEKARADAAEKLLRRYRDEVPPGHSPHMICHEVDAHFAQQEAHCEG